MTSENVLEFRAVSKEFGGTRALKSVSLDLKRGEILALLGENGAGKSTLIKTLAGIYKPDAGEVLFCGEPYHHRPPKPNERQKVTFIHQDLGLIEWMTVAENVGLAQGFSIKNSLIDWKQTARRTAQALELVVLLQTRNLNAVQAIAGRNYAVSAANCCLMESAIDVANSPCCLRII